MPSKSRLRSLSLVDHDPTFCLTADEPASIGHGYLRDSTFQDDHGIAPGSRVTIAAESFGTEKTEGELLAATRTHYSLKRTDERAGTVHVHFPRIGYVLERVEQ